MPKKIASRWKNKIKSSVDFTGDVGKTKQSMKDECDINNIVKKYTERGFATHMNKSQGVYGDFTSLGGFKEAMDTVLAGKAAFASLPSKLRTYFENDPEKFINFMNEPNNIDEKIKLGLLQDRKDDGIGIDSDADVPKDGNAESA